MTDTQFPVYRGRMEYVCLDCGSRHGIAELLYTCPGCGGVLLLEDAGFERLGEFSGEAWRQVFDARAGTRKNALRGIFRFYELMAPVLEEEDIIYLGEGNTPIIEASAALQDKVGISFAFKNDGQNPSASFKDRGMACAFSHIKAMARKYGWDSVLTICASTGDTSAAAALYAAYVGRPVTSVVLLPQGKVTPQQLSQPLGSGATVLELPGVFDDCMKVVEILAARYRVALLNSKNSWRILGQESYAFEAAQWYGWDLGGTAFFVPIGNAGNITAIMSGLLKLYRLGIIETLPRIFGVQSDHADPVYRYYAEKDPDGRRYQPVAVTASAAQAAMIGNPVSFPRVRFLAERYCNLAGPEAFQVVRVSEQAIMDNMLEANRHGHIACTQGGECLAGLRAALAGGLMRAGERALLDATAHALKFADFQTMYFADRFPAEYGIRARGKLTNAPRPLLSPEARHTMPEPEYIQAAANAVADALALREGNALRARR